MIFTTSTLISMKPRFKIFICFLMMTVCLPEISRAEIIEINFAYVGSVDHTALAGAKQGLSEANLQGRFLNQNYNMDVISENDFPHHNFSKYSAVLSAMDFEDYLILTELLPDMPVFNLTDDSNKLRTQCIKNALHIIPSIRMRSDAKKQWQKKKPDSNVNAQAWHHDFKKFAARDLNKRFKKAHKKPMDDYSWAGWAAVKMTADTVARAKLIKPEKILDYLKTELDFDGQKGSNMNFRETGQLRQLILLVDDDTIVAEAPVRGIAKPPTLDSLGLLNCEK